MVLLLAKDITDEVKACDAALEVPHQLDSSPGCCSCCCGGAVCCCGREAASRMFCTRLARARTPVVVLRLGGDDHMDEEDMYELDDPGDTTMKLPSKFLARF